jgi:predicted house-cleaning noncanonical NTP pyrophosphatase (MazG superfamily)
MKYYAEKLALEGNCVLSIVHSTKEKKDYTKEDINILGMEHLKRIEMSDAIFVVNKNGYVDEAVNREIEHAKNHNKEIIYLEKVDNKNDTMHFNKLVRDKIITIIENRGEKANYEILDDENYRKELNKKLVEEVNEYIRENNIEEIVDIIEVMYAILKSKNLSMDKMEEIRQKKKTERGGFEKRIFLKTVSK